MNKDKKIDGIYTAFESLIKSESWDFLNDFFIDLKIRVWRTDVDILLTYATASLPIKSKLPARVDVINTCKHLYKEEGLWDNLI